MTSLAEVADAVPVQLWTSSVQYTATVHTRTNAGGPEPPPNIYTFKLYKGVLLFHILSIM